MDVKSSISTESSEKLLHALLITHLPTVRQGFQKMISQISMIFQYVSYLCNRSLIPACRQAGV
jgi:hypothetical protein